MAELLDGNNLAGRLGAPTREGLIAEIAEIARRSRRALTVVFDGPPEGGRPKVQALGGLTIVYAAPRSADDEIVRRIRESRDPRGLTVVTDDRALASAVRAAGARVKGVEEFRRDGERRLSAPAGGVGSAPAKTVPAHSVSNWEAWFSDPKNRTGA